MFCSQFWQDTAKVTLEVEGWQTTGSLAVAPGISGEAELSAVGGADIRWVEVMGGCRGVPLITFRQASLKLPGRGGGSDTAAWAARWSTARRTDFRFLAENFILGPVLENSGMMGRTLGDFEAVDKRRGGGISSLASGS